MGLPAKGLALLGGADCVALGLDPLPAGAAAVFTGPFPPCCCCCGGALPAGGPAEFVCAVTTAVADAASCAWLFSDGCGALPIDICWFI